MNITEQVLDNKLKLKKLMSMLDGETELPTEETEEVPQEPAA